jgi:hypothetical protein
VIFYRLLQVGVLLTSMVFNNSPIIHAGLQTLHDEQITMGSSLLSLIRIIGGTFGVDVVGPLVAIAARWSSHGAAGHSVLAEFEASWPVSGDHNYFYLLTMLTLCTMIPACFVPSIARSAHR